ncbi:MAG: GspH/FimT family pseudopilin [Candidatus Eisenbacteria bacterium]|nr:GspH/FimT family pseudopilin [Candidatus Eisenbacteria bacterium]
MAIARNDSNEAVRGPRLHVSGCRGMTLVEIMGALVIFGILIALGLPAFRSYFATHEVDGAANNLSVNLRLARQKAATEHNNYKFSYNSGTQSYTILDDDNGNNLADAGEMVHGPVSIPAELTVTNGPLTPFPGDSLVFYPNGTASANGTVVISNAKGFWRLVAVVRSTGAVAVR